MNPTTPHGNGVHSSFTVERLLPGRPSHAYRFWAEPELKRRWNGCHPDWTVLEEAFDFRIGGHEHIRMRTDKGAVQAVDFHYLDLLPGERIVYAYAMRLDDAAISASLVTIELRPHAGGTRMLFTEHLAMLEAGNADVRKQGTEQGFDRLALEIERALAPVH
jgi:uncharacterized protein YndB with AHSA1/START domain